jgi:hypothetical protein
VGTEFPDVVRSEAFQMLEAMCMKRTLKSFNLNRVAFNLKQVI